MPNTSSIEMSSMNSDELHGPSPPYRHAAPSAPWPWIDTEDPIDQELLHRDGPTIPQPCDHRLCRRKCWEDYPQSRFPNWTKCQVEKCGINGRIRSHGYHTHCNIYLLDINKQGAFKDAGVTDMRAKDLDNKWNSFNKDVKPGPEVRLRVLFIENMNATALKMVGAKYDIEPFFFSSSLNRIPSHFQEDLRLGEGDHITVTIPFIRSVPGNSDSKRLPQPWYTADSRRENLSKSVADNGLMILIKELVTRKINVEDPLPVKVQSSVKMTGDRKLMLDLLSVHLIRDKNGSTIISYHGDGKCTQASKLHERILCAGKSVYWQKMLKDVEDPTLPLLIFIWHAIYSWDEALGDLYGNICNLESEVTTAKSMEITETLHIIRAHLLHYSSLLGALKAVVKFIMESPNPALTRDQKKISEHLLERECKIQLGEIDRIEKQRQTEESRVKNVMDLVYSSVNILDSRTAIRDSSVMKQISYLTMIFFPFTLASGIFGMNIDIINPGSRGSIVSFCATAVPLTLFTVWILVAFESRYMLWKENTSIWRRLCWPALLPYWIYLWRKERKETEKIANREYA